MSQCPNNADVFVASQTANFGSESDAAKAMANPDVLSETYKGRLADDVEIAEHDDLAQAVYDTIGPDSFGGDGADAKTRVSANSIARRITAADAEGFAARMLQRVSDAYDFIERNTTVQRVAHYLKLQTWLEQRLRDHRAKLHMWAHSYAGQNDRSLSDNDIVRLSNQAVPRIRGLIESYNRELQPFRQIAHQLAKDLSTTDTEVLRDLGNYAVYRHTPEANAAIIRRWQEEIAIEEAKGDYANLKDIKEYQQRIEDLEEVLEEPDRGDVNRNVRTATGYTNGEARALTEALIAKGYTMEQLDSAADILCNFYNNRYNESVRAGVIPPAMAAAVDKNNFQYYVPAMERKVNNGGSINDVHPFNPGGYYARDGRTDVVDDAYTSINFYARRTANAVGMQPFAEHMLAMGLVNEKTRRKSGRDNGLRVRSVDGLRRGLRRTDDPYRTQLRAYEEHGGLVVQRPFMEDDGSIVYKRYIVAFDENWKDAQGLDGATLNRTLINPPKTAESLNKAALVTSGYGQLFTRFRPAFPVVNMFRDMFERMGHIASRDYFREDGKTVSGMNLLPRYLANMARAGQMLMQVKLGKLPPDSPIMKAYDEYVRLGLHPEYTFARTGVRDTEIDRVVEGRSAFQKAMNSEQGKVLRKAVDKLGEKGRAVLNILDSWNDYYNNIAPFAQFVTLKDAGVPADRAAAATLDSMNMAQTGTAVPVLRALYPFVKPTIQSSAAMLRTLGLSYDPRGVLRPHMKGWGFALGSYAALSSLKDVITDQLGEDENGNARIDGMSLGQLSSFIPIGTGDPDGSYFKLQTGFGLNQIISTLVWGQDRMERGLISADEFASHMLFTTVKNMSPGNWPEFGPKDDIAAFIIQTIAPTISKPVLELATNKNYFGSPIKRGEAPEFTAKANYGSRAAAKVYHELAQSVYQTTGIDMYPEQVQHIIQNLFVGPFRILRSAWESDTVGPQQTQKYRDTHLDPLLEAMGGTLFTGYASGTARNLYFNARDFYEQKAKKDGVKMTAKNYGEYGDRAGFQRAQMQAAGWSENEIADAIAIYEFEQDRAKGAPEMNQQLRNAWLSASELEELRTAFEELAQSSDDVYSNVIDSLNFYRKTS